MSARKSRRATPRPNPGPNPHPNESDGSSQLPDDPASGAESSSPRTLPPRDIPPRTTGPWSRYVALGDSFTEGMCDPDPDDSERFVGWADRVAAALGAAADAEHRDFRYANLAIRGRQLGDITGRQLPLGLDLAPDLVSIVGGGNDILRPRADVDALAASLELAVARLRAAGADVLLGTPTDPRDAPVIRHFRSRNATFTAHVWTIARRYDCAVLDLWGFPALRDWRMWSGDRIHLTTTGHERVAAAALAALGQGGDRQQWETPLPPQPAPSRREQHRSDREWAQVHLRPWVHRRLTGRSSGDGRDPKRPTLQPSPVMPGEGTERP